MIRLGYKLKNYPTSTISLLELSYFQVEKALTNLQHRSRNLSHTVRYIKPQFTVVLLKFSYKSKQQVSNNYVISAVAFGNLRCIRHHAVNHAQIISIYTQQNLILVLAFRLIYGHFVIYVRHVQLG